MIEYVYRGDLLQADAEALVNPVNTYGVMGKGLAAQFKQAFPQNYERYRSACETGEVRPGHMFVTSTPHQLIVNFPTKRHWRSKARLTDIETGLQDLRRILLDRRIASVAIPPLGAGLGGLAWDEVREQIEATLADIPARVLVFAPQE